MTGRFGFLQAEVSETAEAVVLFRDGDQGKISRVSLSGPDEVPLVSRLCFDNGRFTDASAGEVVIHDLHHVQFKRHALGLLIGVGA